VGETYRTFGRYGGLILADRTVGWWMNR